MEYNKRKVRIITAYQCVCSRQIQNIVYNQYLWYFRSKQNPICPREAFQNDLIQFISESIQLGFGIILSIDANENMRGGKLQKLLEETGLIELSALFSNDPPLPSHIMGSTQIDAI